MRRDRVDGCIRSLAPPWRLSVDFGGRQGGVDFSARLGPPLRRHPAPHALVLSLASGTPRLRRGEAEIAGPFLVMGRASTPTRAQIYLRFPFLFVSHSGLAVAYTGQFPSPFPQIPPSFSLLVPPRPSSLQCPLSTSFFSFSH